VDRVDQRPAQSGSGLCEKVNGLHNACVRGVVQPDAGLRTAIDLWRVPGRIVGPSGYSLKIC
jgi:hypothetical protein